jgi:hypothetical protein
MELVDVGPGGELCDKVELSEELTHHLTGIVSLAQHFEPLDDARDGVLSLRNRRVRVVLALAFQALLMFEELFSEEVGEALAPWREVMARKHGVVNNGCLTTTFQGHQ